MYLGFKYKGVDKVGFWKGITFKRNACLNNTDRNKIPVKDHTMLLFCTVSYTSKMFAIYDSLGSELV